MDGDPGLRGNQLRGDDPRRLGGAQGAGPGPVPPRLFVFELTTKDVRPEHVGKLNFYVSNNPLAVADCSTLSLADRELVQAEEDLAWVVQRAIGHIGQLP
ncbi:hypothetical protein [Streptomyces sp. NPDC001480]|uniref:hypothetical protein n=1 Tax=Streptomyces sp. NPDC001480 TaxID=3364577 RepID=UPI00368F963E